MISKHWRTGLILAGLTILAVAIFLLLRPLWGTRAEVREEAKVAISPTMIKRVSAIGQWEFLSISDEELADTVRHGFFGDDELVRIYYGTLRLGIDMSRLGSKWAEARKDSLVCTLPPVKLLDENFIDETRTIAFYESGKWTEQDKADLYERAARQMKERCLTKENLRRAQENARAQFQNLMHAMGYERVSVRFEEGK